MDVTAVQPVRLQEIVAIPDSTRRERFAVAANQTLDGQVISVEGDTVLVSIGQQRVPAQAQPGTTLRPGEAIRLFVRDVDPDQVVMQIVARGGSMQTMRSLTTQDLRSELTGLGVTPDDQAVEIARALINRGLAVTAQNVLEVRAGLTRLGGGAGAPELDAAVFLKGQGLPITPDGVQIVRQALQSRSALGAQVEGLRTALADVAFRLTAQGVVPAPGGPIVTVAPGGEGAEPGGFQPGAMVAGLQGGPRGPQPGGPAAAPPAVTAGVLPRAVVAAGVAEGAEPPVDGTAARASVVPGTGAAQTDELPVPRASVAAPPAAADAPDGAEVVAALNAAAVAEDSGAPATAPPSARFPPAHPLAPDEGATAPSRSPGDPIAPPVAPSEPAGAEADSAPAAPRAAPDGREAATAPAGTTAAPPRAPGGIVADGGQPRPPEVATATAEGPEPGLLADGRPARPAGATIDAGVVAESGGQQSGGQAVAARPEPSLPRLLAVVAEALDRLPLLDDRAVERGPEALAGDIRRVIADHGTPVEAKLARVLEGLAGRADLDRLLANDLKSSLQALVQETRAQLAVAERLPPETARELRSAHQQAEALLGHVELQQLANAAPKSDGQQPTYLMFQLPIPGGREPQTAQIRIRQESDGQTAKIDPKNVHVVFQLELQNLSTVRVGIRVVDKHLSCQMGSSDPAATELLAQHAPELREGLAGLGYVVDAIKTATLTAADLAVPGDGAAAPAPRPAMRVDARA